MNYCFKILVFILFLIFFSQVFSCFFIELELDDKEAEKKLHANSKTKAVYFNYEAYGHKMRYVFVKGVKRQTTKGKPVRKNNVLLFFIHGSPGAWTNYIEYLANPTLQNSAEMISVDRLGYGHSTRGHAESSLRMQAKMLAPILDKYYKKYSIILVGHSLGGSVIARMILDYPSKIAGLCFISSAVSAEVEEPAWYNILADWPPVKWILPKDIYTSNQEILPLKSELLKLMDSWGKIKVPVTIIHGKKDKLVPVANANFLKEVLVNSQVRALLAKKEGHFILWENKDLITKELLYLVDRVSKR